MYEGDVFIFYSLKLIGRLIAYTLTRAKEGKMMEKYKTWFRVLIIIFHCVCFQSTISIVNIFIIQIIVCRTVYSNHDYLAHTHTQTYIHTLYDTYTQSSKTIY